MMKHAYMDVQVELQTWQMIVGLHMIRSRLYRNSIPKT